MPIIAIVDGVEIKVFWNDHNPPHIHAVLAEHNCCISIVTGAIMSGTLPKAKFRKVVRWLEDNQTEAMYAWDEAHNSRPYKGKIK